MIQHLGTPALVVPPYCLTLFSHPALRPSASPTHYRGSYSISTDSPRSSNHHHHSQKSSSPKMHLQVYIVDGKRVYTLKKVDPEGKPTLSAHPARFSPDDKFSRHRVVIKRRFKVLPSERRLQPL